MVFCVFCMMYLVVKNMIVYIIVVLDDGVWFKFFDCIYLGSDLILLSFMFFFDLVVSFYFFYVMIVGIVLE